MYPDLSYLFHDLFGTAPDNAFSVIKTFGLFLALAFLASAYELYLEFRRREEMGVFKASERVTNYDKNYLYENTLVNALIAFFFGFIHGISFINYFSIYYPTLSEE